MANVVNFNMVVEINQLLKEKEIEYSIHALGGCPYLCRIKAKTRWKRVSSK